MIVQPEPGRMYRVRYRYQAANYRVVVNEMIAKFIGTDHWSLRPLAGSQLGALDIIDLERVPDGTPPRMPYKP